MAEATRIVLTEYCGKLTVCLQGAMWPAASLQEGLKMVVVDAFVFHTHYRPEDECVYPIVEKLMGIPEAKRTRVSGVTSNGYLKLIPK